MASFNARWGLDLENRPYGIADVVERFDTDLVAVQEVFEPNDEPHPLAEVAERGGYRIMGTSLAGSYLDPRPEITRDRATATGEWGIVLLSRLPVIEVRTLDLGRLVDRWDVADRLALTATVAVDGHRLVIAAVHLSFALPNAVAQLRTLADRIPRRVRSVVVGDCNLWGPMAAAVLGGRRRAVRGRTWPAQRPHSQLDHILLSDGLSALEGSVLEPVGSDHLPIRATIALG